MSLIGPKGTYSPREIQLAAHKRREAARQIEQQIREKNAPLVIEDYAAYLQSKWWKAKRAQKLKAARGICQKCGGKATEVHHLHYQSLGREKNKHLMAVCRPCHDSIHIEKTHRINMLHASLIKS
jgi:5-methylcytosine-specific restriction endonuclease McrA